MPDPITTNVGISEVGALATLALVIFLIVRSVMATNKFLIEQNQANIQNFLEQINHQQTQNREALQKNTSALSHISDVVDRNNQINDKLLSILKKNGNA